MVKKAKTIDIVMSKENIKFRISFEKDKWLTQFIYCETPKFPKIPSKTPLYELNEGRNKQITKVLVSNGVFDDDEVILNELMSLAGEKLEELEKLTIEDDEDTTF